MKKIYLFVAAFLLTAATAFSQQTEVIETNFKVFGNCNLCKERIEKSVKIEEVKYSKWNKNTKMMKVIFQPTITIDSLQQRIINAGHDTEKFKAQNEVYKKLPLCCLYRDNTKTH
jgi:hypothetical protein